MESLKILFLAVVQGVTEILPVSSSGHLVILKHWQGVHSPGLLLEAVLHGGSLLAILLFYRKRLLQLLSDYLRNQPGARRYVGAILLGCIPAALVGALWGDWIEEAFDSPRAAAIGLLATGGILLVAGRFRLPVRAGGIGFSQALGVGMVQILALWPGVSRSGTTISAGRMTGADEQQAAEFSFFMAIPLLGGVLALALLKVLSGKVAEGTPPGLLVLGFAVTALTGYGAMALLHRLLASRRMWMFGVYCLLVGTAVLHLMR